MYTHSIYTYYINTNLYFSSDQSRLINLTALIKYICIDLIPNIKLFNNNIQQFNIFNNSKGLKKKKKLQCLIKNIFVF